MALAKFGMCNTRIFQCFWYYYCSYTLRMMSNLLTADVVTVGVCSFFSKIVPADSLSSLMYGLMYISF